jgi:hypothetical protein
MTLLDTIDYYLDQILGEMECISWEIREGTNHPDCNQDTLTEDYDLCKENYDNLQKIKTILENLKND